MDTAGQDATVEAPLKGGLVSYNISYRSYDF